LKLSTSSDVEGSGLAQSLALLSIMLVLSLLTNLAAFPVILFRKTRSASPSLA
jgi:hypothetical protein